MTVSVTVSQLSALCPRLLSADRWCDALNKTFVKYDISNRQRVRCFLSQTIYESNYYREFAENLNYSADRLLEVFPTHFDYDQAQQYAHDPIRIASRAYANRMGNGDERSQDGWRYRGRGIIATTGHDNYKAFADSVAMTVQDAATYCETIEGACMSGGYFWKTHGCNALADNDQFTAITVKINGGLNGLADRKALWSTVRSVIV